MPRSANETAKVAIFPGAGHCEFCGQDKRGRRIAVPGRDIILICLDCIDLALKWWQGDIGVSNCSTCGQLTSAVRYVNNGRGPYAICWDCARLLIDTVGVRSK